jgi:hypothetical protein
MGQVCGTLLKRLSNLKTFINEEFESKTIYCSLLKRLYVLLQWQLLYDRS